LVLCLTAGTAPPTGSQGTDADSAVVHKAAAWWLAQVDSAHYAISVDSAAPLFQQMVGSADGWRQFVESARRRYPVSPDREVTSWEPSFTPDGAPPGRYARIAFRSRTGPRSTETLVLLLTPAGWRVAMYGLTG
jgi:hypothetical protein